MVKIQSKLTQYNGARYLVMRDGVETAYHTRVGDYSHEWNHHSAVRVDFRNRKEGEEWKESGHSWVFIKQLYG